MTALALDPADASGNVLFLGTAGGGVWKSTNAAGAPSQVSFTPLTDTLAGYSYTTSDYTSLSIGALTVQPGGTGVVLAGTGDPNGSPDAGYGNGILRSTDGGNTWGLITHSNDRSYGPGNNFYFFGLSFTGFAWSTATPGLVVAAVADSVRGSVLNAGYAGSSEMGLYYSRDAGATWQLATIADGPSVLQSPTLSAAGGGGNAVTAVVWNPLRQLFVAAIRFHGYYGSSDGTSWSRLANQPGSGLTPGRCPPNTAGAGQTGCPIYRGELAVQPVTGDTFAITTDSNNADGGVYRDVCAATRGVCTSGATFGFGQKLTSTALEASDGSGTIPQASYHLWLRAVLQGGDTLLFAGTQDIYRCSLNAGCAWRNTTHVTGCTTTAGVAASQHAVEWLSGSGTLYFGNDGGLWRTTDGAAVAQSPCSADDASHFDNLNSRIGAIGEPQSLAGDPTSAGTLLVSTRANGTAALAEGAPVWSQVLAGTGAGVAIDAVTPQNWYANSGAGVSISACSEGAQCAAGGFGSQPAVNEADVAGDGVALPLPAAWMLDPQDTTQTVVGTCRVWRGAAAGTAWSGVNAISPMLDGDNAPACQGNAQIRSLAISGQVPGQPPGTERIYAGMAGYWDGGATAPGRLFGALVRPGDTAGTTHWANLSASPVANDPGNSGRFNPGAFAVSAIAADPHDASGQTVYAAIQGFGGSGLTQSVSEPLLYASGDAGQHWRNITANLPDAPVNAVLIDPSDAGIVYVGTDSGVYVTGNVSSCGLSGAQCWSIYGAGIPRIPVTTLAAFTGGGRALLRAGTAGRGVWETALASRIVSADTIAGASPAALSFGNQPVQTLSAYSTVTVTNGGALALTLGQMAVSGDFLEQNACPPSLAPGAACSLQIAFLPSASGARTGSITIPANVSGGQLSIPLSGSGTAGSLAVLTPSQLLFGNAQIGTRSREQNLTVANTGTAVLSVASVSVTAPFVITTNTCGSALASLTSCTVALAFAPTLPGNASGTLSVTGSGGTQTALLSGTGVTAATGVLSTSALTFGPQALNTRSAPQAVALTNGGDTALTLISTSISGDFGVENLCGASLPAHSTCSFQVTYAPTALGAAAGQLIVNDMLGSQSVALNGTGTAPAGLSLSPEAIDFGEEAIGGSTPVKNLTLANNTGIPLTGISIAVSGDFSLGGGGACGGSLPAGSSCTVPLVFTPAATGTRAGALTLTSDGQGSLASSLSGMGVDFAISVVGSATATVVGGSTATYSLQVTSLGASSGTVALSCSGAPAGSTCSVSPSPVPLAVGTPANVTVSVTTPSQSAARTEGEHAGAFLVLAVLLPLGRKLRLGRSTFAMLLIAAAVVLSLGGCGLTINGGGSGSGGGSGGPGGGGSGSYGLVVTASVPGLQHAVGLTLNVE